MKYHGVSVYSNNKFYFSIPYVYTNNGWKQVDPYVKIGNQWHLVGAAGRQMLQFIDSNGNPVYVNNEPLLVLEELGTNT